MDLSKLGKISNFIESLIKRFKKIDILVNNAGIALPKKISQIDYSDLNKSFSINFFAPSLITKVLKIMKKEISVE